MKRRVLLASITALSLSGCAIFGGGGDDGPTTPTVGERLPVLVYEQRIEADPELAQLAVVLPPPAVNADWTQPGGSAAKSLGHLSLPETVARGWQASIGQGSSSTRRLNAAPVVADGRVYTIDTVANIRAFDAQTGRSVWQASISRKGEGSNIAFGGGVSAGGGRVYATSGYGIAAAFDAATGQQVWRVDLGAPLRGAPTVDGDRVYVLSQDNQLFALNAADGQTVWDATGTVEAASLLGAASPAVGFDTVVVGFSSGELIALRVENGRTVWQDALARTGRTTALASLTDIDASPVIDRGRVFAIGHGGRIAALELATGQRVWERNLAGVSLPWVAGDFIYAVTLDGELVCLTRGDGRVRWVSQLQRYEDEEDKKRPIRWSGPVLASDRLILTGSNGQMVSVSPYTGKTLSSIKLSGPAFLPPIVANNAVYVLTDDGKLTSYR